MKIGYIDLKKQYNSIKNEIDEAIREVFEEAVFTGPNKFVDTFEIDFAATHHAKHCVALNSGTAALHAVLMALGIGPGDEVIVPANTFFATPQSVSLVGAIPVFVDCEERFYNIDPEKVELAITKKTKAIIAVHLYGQPAELMPLKEIADKHGLYLIEDCAQAHLAQYHDSFVGTIGIAGCFSFYPVKNLGSFGEGGAVTTNDEYLASQLRLIRSNGSVKKYYHERIGHNFRMESLQGAILAVKLKHLDKWTETRIYNAALYSDYLGSIENVTLPKKLATARHVYHAYIIRINERDELKLFLGEKGICTEIHYPIPCHLQPAYKFLKYQKGSMPVTEQVAKQILSLPISDQLLHHEIEYITSMIARFYR